MMRHPGRWVPPLVLLALLVSLAFTGGCAKNLMEADTTPPVGSRITNPVDGTALNSQVIDVRGRAEVGATVRIFVNGVLEGSAVAYPPAQSEGGLGRFTVENIQLGDEGPKEILGVVTDLYGNRAEHDLVANVLLDMHAPPVAFETFIDAQLNEQGTAWETGLPAVTLIGRTDTTAAVARVRYGINQFTPDVTSVFPGQPGEPDSMRFWIPMTSPPLTVANPDSTVIYHVEAIDLAGNTSSESVQLSWVAAGKETALSWDDGSYGSAGNSVTGQSGMALAVLFQAPPWANFVTGMEMYVMNDGVNNPDDPQGPTTAPFLARVWKPDGSLRPGEYANSAGGYSPFGWYGYPEDQLVDFYYPNAINITNNNDFPDKQFFAGIEFQFRSNPEIGFDTDEPIDSRSFRWNWTEWEMATADYIIHAIVSDLQSAGGRTARLEPVIVRIPQER